VSPAEPKVKLEPETKSEDKVKQESVSESEYEVKASGKRTHRGKRGGRKYKQCSTSTPDSGASGATAARPLPPLASTPDARRSLQGPSPHRDDAASVAQDEHVDHHAERNDMTSIGNTAIAEEAQQLPGDIRTDMREMLAKINRLGKLLKTLSSNGSGHG
jgi:hypothetical protein